MKPLGPDEGINALRHPDCRFCDEYQALMRGVKLERDQAKAALPTTTQGGDAHAARAERPAPQPALQVAGPEPVEEDGLGAECPATIAEKHWPACVYIGGDEGRPWLIWWRSPREDFETRCYVPASPHPAEEKLVELVAWLEAEVKAADECDRDDCSGKCFWRGWAFRAVLQYIRETKGKDDV